MAENPPGSASSEPSDSARKPPTNLPDIAEKGAQSIEPRSEGKRTRGKKGGPSKDTAYDRATLKEEERELGAIAVPEPEFEDLDEAT